MKTSFLFASAAAMAMFAAPAMAQDESTDEPADVVQDSETAAEIDFSNLDQDEALEALRTEIEAEFGMLSGFFKVDPLTPEQEARLPLAQDMTDRIFPKGTFGTVMEEALEPLMGMVMGAVAGDARLRLGAITGVEATDLAALSDEQAQEALDIFDPGYAGRTTKIGTVAVEMVGRLFDTIEPSYRDAMARALTTRFDDAEIRDALTQLDNPLVTKLTQQSFLVHYDSQMLAVMEQLGPALMEVMPGMMQDFGDLESEMADEGRIFTELSATERRRAARLLGKSENELDALAPKTEEAVSEDAESAI